MEHYGHHLYVSRAKQADRAVRKTWFAGLFILATLVALIAIPFICVGALNIMLAWM